MHQPDTAAQAAATAAFSHAVQAAATAFGTAFAGVDAAPADIAAAFGTAFAQGTAAFGGAVAHATAASASGAPSASASASASAPAALPAPSPPAALPTPAPAPAPAPSAAPAFNPAPFELFGGSHTPLSSEAVFGNGPPLVLGGGAGEAAADGSAVAGLAALAHGTSPADASAAAEASAAAAAVASVAPPSDSGGPSPARKTRRNPATRLRWHESYTDRFGLAPGTDTAGFYASCLFCVATNLPAEASACRRPPLVFRKFRTDKIRRHLLHVHPANWARYEAATPNERRAFFGPRPPPEEAGAHAHDGTRHAWRDEYRWKFGLESGVDGEGYYGACRFCKVGEGNITGKGRRSKAMKFRKFRSDKIKLHLVNVHPQEWEDYQKLSGEDLRGYFGPEAPYAPPAMLPLPPQPTPPVPMPFTPAPSPPAVAVAVTPGANSAAATPRSISRLQWRDDYVWKFGLRTGSDVESFFAECMFCIATNLPAEEDASAKRKNAVFRKFRTDKIKQHLKIVHPVAWERYQKLSREELRGFFGLGGPAHAALAPTGG